MSRLLGALTLSLVLVPIASSVSSADWMFKRGDCNSDGQFDTADAVTLLERIFAAAPAGACDDACDANDDGSLNLADAIAMLAALFEGTTQPPTPYFTCGTDPTDDALGCDGPLTDCPPAVATDVAEPPRPTTSNPSNTRRPTPDRPGEDNNVAGRGVHPYSGEFVHDEEDLRIRGRGMDFVWKRTYRSRTDTSGHIGHGWEFSYAISAQPVAGGVIIADGTGRRDFFVETTPGVFERDGFFQVGSYNADGAFIVDFADHGRWTFVDGGAAVGKIEEIRDRNGNSITFAYDGTGRLQTITDTLSRTVAIGYDADDRITDVTDFTGRTVSYQYYTDPDTDGAEGDLKSRTTPSVVGTSTGNDFPLGKTTTYTYSTGFANDVLNHNLLSITDGKGQTFLTNTYGTSGDEEDRLVEQFIGGHSIQFHATTDTGLPGATVMAVINDRLGRVTEHFYDAENRCLMTRRYTGFASPTVATTTTLNRPSGALRTGDPAFFETRYSWNADAQLTEVIHAGGNATTYERQLAIDPAASRFERANIRARHEKPTPTTPLTDPSVITDSFDYLPGFGGWTATDFVTLHTDPCDNTTTHDYDAFGNLLHTVHAITGVEVEREYNAFGQLITLWHPDPDHTDGADGVPRRRDDFVYYVSGPQAGYLQNEIVDVENFALTTAYGYDAFGNVVQTTDPNGHTTTREYNQLDQLVRETDPTISGIPPYRRSYFYDANDNLVRIDTRNVNWNGALSLNQQLSEIRDYDLLNRLVLRCREAGNAILSSSQLDCSGLGAPDFVRTGYEYDANDQLIRTSFGEAMNGNQPDNLRTSVYDERGLVFRETRSQDASASTTEYDYDGNGNLVRQVVGTEAAGHETTYTVDFLGRVIAIQDPMGNVESMEYDPCSNVVHRQIDGELTDVLGSIGNVRLFEEAFSYDALHRRVAHDVQFFDPATQSPLTDGLSSTQFLYDGVSQLEKIVDDNGHTTEYLYDSSHRRQATIDPLGNWTLHTFDQNSNVVVTLRQDYATLGGVAPQAFTDTYTYDALDRRVTHTDNLGQTTTAYYDSRGNVQRTVDRLGNVIMNTFDGLSRNTAVARTLTDTGDGSGLGIDTVTTFTDWDASSRIVARTDDAGNSTEYSYDPLDRRTITTFADGTTESASYDVYGNVVAEVDANGSVIAQTYDLLNRLTFREIAPGPGVSDQTTFEQYEYDGLSRVVYAENDEVTVVRTHDSLSHQTSETTLPLGVTVSRAHDGVGNVTTLSYPGGEVIASTYDGLRRHVSLTRAGASLADYFYLGDRVLRRDNGNPTRFDVAYDGLGRPVETKLSRSVGIPWVLDRRTYQWDAMSNKTERLEVTPGGLGYQNTYEYDSLYRLTRARVLAVTGALLRDSQYQLDGVGNRVSVDDGGCPGLYVMSSDSPPSDAVMNQYTETSCGDAEYDDAGNRTVLAGVTTEFDYRNRLVRYSPGASPPVIFVYDPFGRRVAKGSDSGGSFQAEEQYVYDDWQLIELREDTGLLIRSYVYGNGIDEILAFIDPGFSPYYFHSDDMGNIMAIGTPAGSVVERYDYDDYGTPTIYDASWSPLFSSEFANVHLFNGHRYFEELGLYDYRHRLLDPNVGRFISRDPIGIWGDTTNMGNGSSYVNNNPWTHTDPLGLFNPQPEPPASSMFDPMGSLATMGPLATLPALGFNPAPPPPASGFAAGVGSPTIISAVGFNPAPPPPTGVVAEAVPPTVISPVGFNPAPPPPTGVMAGSASAAGFLPGGYSPVASPTLPLPPPRRSSPFVDPLVAYGFNPQPEPPPGLSAQFVDPLTMRGFNPQPEPPGQVSGFVDPLTMRGFNPQPEPPATFAGFVDPLTMRGFNPQPEPPADGMVGF